MDKKYKNEAVARYNKKKSGSLFLSTSWSQKKRQIVDNDEECLLTNKICRLFISMSIIEQLPKKYKGNPISKKLMGFVSNLDEYSK